MPACITGIGLATPSGVADQSQALTFAIDSTLSDPNQRGLVEGLYKRAGVQTRSSAILASTTSPAEPLDQTFFPALAPAPGSVPSHWPTTSQRMSAFATHAGPLASAAARSALQSAIAAPNDITHLITVSCTGLEAPGVDVELVRALGLGPNVERLNLGFMGCHGGIVAIRTAAALARAPHTIAPAKPPCILAVCIELCTLHTQRTTRADQHVANALFADGAAAIIVRPSTAPATAPSLAIQSASSILFEGSAGAMGWRIGDHGFEMTLDRTVPALLERHLGPWVWPWLQSELGSSIQARDLLWAVHPGGPRVLDSVERALGLELGAVHVSRKVLSDHGNMSSATVLFILHAMQAAQPAPAPDARPIVMLAFGPGLTGEAVLLNQAD